MLPRNVAIVGYRTWLELGIHHDAPNDDRALKGIVRVCYRDGTSEDFQNIDRREYFTWANVGFRPSRAPMGVAFRAFSREDPQDVDLDNGEEWALTAQGWLTEDEISEWERVNGTKILRFSW